MRDRVSSLVSDANAVQTLSSLAGVLRRLRRREARQREGPELSYRDLATMTGWSHAMIGEYFTGTALAPTDRFDVLIQLLGASAAEQGALANARDRVEENRRSSRASRPIGRPRELPPGISTFVGRERELARLNQLADRRSRALVVLAISGAGGVGKTALALNWAHRIADRYPDGQLFANLHGYSSRDPLRPTDVLARFLRSLGVDRASLPEDPTELAARYRSMLAGRRMLIVLDNARSAEQVRPLLPGTPSCLVLVTSRDHLAGLVAIDGAQRLDLEELSTSAAEQLLYELIGERAREEEVATAALIRHCGHLPLALRVAAEHAAAHPEIPLSELAAELADERRRLDVLDGGDEGTSVRTVLSWSYNRLDSESARVFALLGLHPGRDIDPYALAALAGIDLETARVRLRSLLRAHLVRPGRGDRCRIPDLLRAYAIELADTTVDADTAAQARVRLFNYYRHTAAVALDAMRDTDQARTAVPYGQTAIPSMGHAALARSWLDAERDNLVAMCVYAARHGMERHSSELSQTLCQYLDTGPHPAGQADLGRPRALTMHGIVVRHGCTQEIGDLDAALAGHG